MSTILERSISSDGDPIYFNQKFRDTLEYLLPSILEHQGNTVIPLDTIDNIQGKYDFNRILAKKNIMSRAYWWLIMRMNGLTNPHQYQGNLTAIIIPDTQLLDQIVQQYLTTNAIR